MNLKAMLKSQYHASLAMLKQAIELCPEELWTAKDHPNAFWQAAYHTLFFTHLYLQPDEHAFQPWELTRAENHLLGNEVPWPPHRPPNISEPYTKQEILDYWQLCDAMIDDGVDRLDLEENNCGFSWYSMPKLEHQMMNLRHIQHHVGELSILIRTRDDIPLDWAGNTP